MENGKINQSIKHKHIKIHHCKIVLYELLYICKEQRKQFRRINKMTKFENKVLDELLRMKEEELKGMLESGNDLPVKAEMIDDLIAMMRKVQTRLFFIDEEMKEKGLV